MATPATLNTGKSNRRFVILAVVLGLLGAILIYATFSRDSGSGDSTTTNAVTVPVVVAKEEIPARTKITGAMLEVRLVAEDARSELAFSDPSQVIGQTTRFPIAANEQLNTQKVVTASGSVGVGTALSYTIPAGMRGVAIQASQIIDAGGLVLPGDYVDILVVYDVEFDSASGTETKDSYLVQTLMQNVEVLAVSQTVVDTVSEAEPSDENNQRVRNSDAAPNPDAVTVTLAVSPEDAQMLYLAESNGRLRLSVRPYGDGTEEPVDYLLEPDLFPSNLPNPFLQ